MSVLDRPDWDTYFISLCFLVAQRSIDPNTKHGCVAVDDDKTVLSMGYNSPPRGCIDSEMPLTRPQKYGIFAHSEVNCITNAARAGINLKGSTFYITGYPCEKCLGAIINVGAKKVVYGPVGSFCINEESKKIIELILKGQSIILEEFKAVDKIKNLLNKTQNYIDQKTII